MTKLKLFVPAIILCILGSVLFVSCDALKSDDDPDDGTTPDAVQAQVATIFAENSAAPFVMMEALTRAILELSGSPEEGVTFTPRPLQKGQALIFDAVIGLDFDNNGTFEVEVIGDLEFPGDEANLDKGAVLHITEITGAGVTGTATANVTASGPGGAFAGGVGSFQGASGPPVDIDFSLTVSLFQSSLSGVATVTAGDLDMDVFFEPPDSGGSIFGTFQIRVVSPAFDEFVVGGSFN